MRFLADQDVYRITLDLLRGLGHEVITAAQLMMSRSSDEELLEEALRRDCIFLTRDKDFGTLVFLRSASSCGVILLRMRPTTVEECHKELKRLLLAYSEESLKRAFWVVEPGQHRRRDFGGTR